VDPIVYLEGINQRFHVVGGGFATSLFESGFCRLGALNSEAVISRLRESAHSGQDSLLVLARSDEHSGDGLNAVDVGLGGLLEVGVKGGDSLGKGS